mmetsp:Transcript_23289/g.37840  ORF Transcript_23289/g.37840 Transcript_23289/m.37840 type:complete len:92 (+) Transcript_23289:816-1091(+)
MQMAGNLVLNPVIIEFNSKWYEFLFLLFQSFIPESKPSNLPVKSTTTLWLLYHDMIMMLDDSTIAKYINQRNANIHQISRMTVSAVVFVCS